MKTKRTKRIDAAIRLAKQRYDGCCIITGLYPDGAHILPRLPFRELAADSFNIIPLHRRIHKMMDVMAKTDFIGRVEFLYKNCLPEYRGIFREQLEQLLYDAARLYPLAISRNIMERLTDAV